MVKTAKKEKKHIPLVIGNWKMNPPTLEKSTALFGELKKTVPRKNVVAQVVVAAPTLFIASLSKLSKNTRFHMGAQDAFYEPQGAFTGETSILMLKSVGVSHVILGHSERRALGESNEEIKKKVDAVLKSGLTAVVCIGEKVRDTQGDYFSFVEAQLKSVLTGLLQAHTTRLVIAYEPVWAIGTGKHATADDVQEMKLFIQKVIADTLGRNVVSKMRILYGGSVTKDNAQELLEVGHADGFLVGGSSLKSSEFGAIVSISDTYARA